MGGGGGGGGDLHVSDVIIHSPLQVAAYPGETVNLAIFAVDELGTPTSAVVDFADDSQSSFSGSTQVAPPPLLVE